MHKLCITVSERSEMVVWIRPQGKIESDTLTKLLMHFLIEKKSCSRRIKIVLEV